MNTAIQPLPNEPIISAWPALKLVEFSSNNGISKGQQCLADIRKQLALKARNAAHIYDNVLTEKQRLVLGNYAQVSALNVGKSFYDLTKKQRLSIQECIIQFGKIFNLFNDAMAINTSKFLKEGEHCHSVLTPEKTHDVMHECSSYGIAECYEELVSNEGQ